MSGIKHIVAIFPNKSVSNLGIEVANLLDELYNGIYHIRHNALAKVSWDNEIYISIIVEDASFATYDFNRLTKLVVLCHDKCMRCEIHGKGPGYIELIFHKRKCRDGQIYERHPTIEDHVKLIRGKK